MTGTAAATWKDKQTISVEELRPMPVAIQEEHYTHVELARDPRVEINRCQISYLR